MISNCHVRAYDVQYDFDLTIEDGHNSIFLDFSHYGCNNREKVVTFFKELGKRDMTEVFVCPRGSIEASYFEGSKVLKFATERMTIKLSYEEAKGSIEHHVLSKIDQVEQECKREKELIEMNKKELSEEDGEGEKEEISAMRVFGMGLVVGFTFCDGRYVKAEDLSRNDDRFLEHYGHNCGRIRSVEVIKGKMKTWRVKDGDFGFDVVAFEINERYKKINNLTMEDIAHLKNLDECLPGLEEYVKAKEERKEKESRDC